MQEAGLAGLRTAMPKQLLALANSRSLLPETVLRLQGHDRIMPPVVVCNEASAYYRCPTAGTWDGRHSDKCSRNQNAPSFLSACTTVMARSGEFQFIAGFAVALCASKIGFVLPKT